MHFSSVADKFFCKINKNLQEQNVQNRNLLSEYDYANLYSRVHILFLFVKVCHISKIFPSFPRKHLPSRTQKFHPTETVKLFVVGFDFLVYCNWGLED